MPILIYKLLDKINYNLYSSLHERRKQIKEYYSLLEYIENNPENSQGDISSDLKYSLGKVNYLFKELTKTGLVKADRFLNSKNKWGYRYILTPKGVQEKYEITKRYLARKEAEYEALKKELKVLREKVG